MESLDQIQEIFAGIHNIYIVDSEGTIFGDIIDGELQNITLSDGYNYLKIPITLNTADYNSISQSKKIFYNNTNIELYVPGNDLDQLQELINLDGKTFILIFEDRQNNYWVSGSPDNPLRFIDKYSSGKSGSEFSGRKFIFENENMIQIISVNFEDQSESSPIEYDTLAFYLNSSASNFEIEITTTQAGYIYFRYSDGRTWSLYCDTVNELIFIPGNEGVLEITGGYGIIDQINSTYDGIITKVVNLNLITQLTILTLTANPISEIDITPLINLETAALGQGEVLNILELPNTNTLEKLYMTDAGLISIDLSPAPNSRIIYLDYNNLSSIDMSVLNLGSEPLGGAIFIKLNNNNLNQAAIDQIISDILDIITITGYSGTLYIQNNAAPSTQGLSDISTLETTYGWTITYD